MFKFFCPISLIQTYLWGVLLKRTIYSSNIKFSTWSVGSGVWLFVILGFKSNLILEFEGSLLNKHLISSFLVSGDTNSVPLNIYSLARRDTLRNWCRLYVISLSVLLLTPQSFFVIINFCISGHSSAHFF